MGRLRKDWHRDSRLLDLLASFFGAAPRYVRPSLDLQLIGQRVTLRMGDTSDWRAWRNLREMSRDFLVPWEPSWPPNALTNSFFCAMLRRQWREWRQGRAYAFMIFLRDAKGGKGSLAGSITLNDIQRGIAQKGTLGYWIGRPYAGQGLMTEAAGLACDFAFKTLGLHRIEASCLPQNEPSKKLLRRLGFTEEGFAKSYLCINGEWRDHMLWGKGKG